jgi:succinate dehydrogenase/fumarate reductase flavoprotein subunit
VVEIGSSMEWNKSFISYASAKEIREGKGGPNGGIYFSRGDIPWENMEFYCQLMFPNWKYKAIDLSEWGKKLKADEPVEVGPAVEYFDGGIVVNERFETGVKGLFAAGECTLGAFGSNRVFSAITEILVHGLDAGQNAGDYTRNTQVPESNKKAFEPLEERAVAPLLREEGLKPGRVRRRIQETAHKKLGPIRNEKELESFIQFLGDIKREELPRLTVTSKNRTYNKEWIDALELENMVHLLEAAARSALFRTESRGVHFREDFPNTDNHNWLQESIVKITDNDMEVGKRPVTVTSITPPKGVWPYLEMLKLMMEAHSDVGGHH